MPKIVVGNVDCESQCGIPGRRSAEERASSARVANRMAWFLAPGDLFVTPYPLSVGMLGYIGRFNGFDAREVCQISPGSVESGAVLITEELINRTTLIDQIRAQMNLRSSYGLVSYFPDPGSGTLAQCLKLEVPARDLA